MYYPWSTLTDGGLLLLVEKQLPDCNWRLNKTSVNNEFIHFKSSLQIPFCEDSTHSLACSRMMWKIWEDCLSSSFFYHTWCQGVLSTHTQIILHIYIVMVMKVIIQSGSFIRSTCRSLNPGLRNESMRWLWNPVKSSLSAFKYCIYKSSFEALQKVRLQLQHHKYGSSLKIFLLPCSILPGLKGVFPLLKMSWLSSFQYCWGTHRDESQPGGLRAEHDRSWKFFGVLRYLYWELSLHVV